MKSQRVRQDRVCRHTHAHIPINESQKNDKNVSNPESKEPPIEEGIEPGFPALQADA